MSFIEIMKKIDELSLNRSKIGMKIAGTLIAFNVLFILAGYILISEEGTGAITDIKQAIFLFAIFAFASSLVMCVALTSYVLRPLKEFEATANLVADRSVYSAVNVLNDIGMRGIINGATAIEHLAGREAVALHSKLRPLTINQMNDEIVSLGDSITLVEVELRSLCGELNGKMQLYFSKETALNIANELLCSPPDQNAAGREFGEEVISTLKEASSIFGDQYVNVISESTGVPILTGVPSIKNGASRQIAESVIKDIEGKVEFALASSIAFAGNKTGRLILLLEPKSMNLIIMKLN